MPESIDAFFAFAAAAAIAWLLVPVAETFAWRIGAIDEPRERSLHVAPTPRLSGIAILIAVCASGAIFLPWDEQTRAILIGAVVIATVGMIDDIWDLPPLVKLLGQTAAAIIPVTAGVTVDVFTLPFVGGVDLAGTELYPPDAPLFHIIRALDMADRCVDCGMCEISCPASIPLRSLYRQMCDLFKESFGYEPGLSVDDRSPLTFLGEPADFGAHE